MDTLANFETKSQIQKKKKERSRRNLAIANVASERERALIEITRRSTPLLSVSDCLSSQKKKIVFAANFAIDCNLLWIESRGVCWEISKMQEGRLLAFFQFANSVTFKGHCSQEKSFSKKYRTFKRKTA